MKSIIAGLRQYLAKVPFIEELTDGVKIDFTSSEPADVGVMPTGETLIEYCFDGSSRWQYDFSLYARCATLTDLERLSNSEFLEHFSLWIREQDNKGNYPELPPGMYAESITCANGALFSVDDSAETGLYQIQCHLFYEKIKE